jgi:CheY-like chemotaxis protein
VQEKMLMTDQHTALVVDDEADVCRLTGRMLVEAGFAVALAMSGPEALALLSDSVDVIVLDFRMPGMNGREVVRRARLQGSTAPVLFISGCLEIPADVSSEELPQNFLTKPFTSEQLVCAVQGLLETRV